MKKQQVYIIAGPTASGKSGLALDLAEKIDGEIVNADAFQVYDGLQILTARPTLQEMQGSVDAADRSILTTALLFHPRYFLV